MYGALERDNLYGALNYPLVGNSLGMHDIGPLYGRDPRKRLQLVDTQQRERERERKTYFAPRLDQHEIKSQIEESKLSDSRRLAPLLVLRTVCCCQSPSPWWRDGFEGCSCWLVAPGRRFEW